MRNADCGTRNELLEFTLVASRAIRIPRFALDFTRATRQINRSLCRELSPVPGTRSIRLYHRRGRTKAEYRRRVHQSNKNYTLDVANTSIDLVSHQGACFGLPSALLRTSGNRSLPQSKGLLARIQCQWQGRYEAQSHSLPSIWPTGASSARHWDSGPRSSRASAGRTGA